MSKNLILIHLESISNTILWQYRVELGTVWRLMQQSFIYNRFYGSSTSTDTILVDLFNGCSDTFDGVSLFTERNNSKQPWIQNNGKYNTLYTSLLFARYHYLAVHEHYLGPSRDSGSDLLDHNLENLLARSRDNLAKCKSAKEPLTLLFRMVISHMAFDDHVKIKAQTFSERFRLGYLQLDRAINRLLSMVMELGLWDDSMIVCYGDHGDELWSHGLNKGYCHVITPYASLNWTPLFIYESGQAPGSSDQLISTIDLRETLVKRLVPNFDTAQCRLGVNWINSWRETLPPNSPPPAWLSAGTLPPFRQTPYDGIDAFNEKRELAFCQNLFALQLEYSDPEQGLTKGYSVTDGVYHVVVSSGGSDPRNGGLEFYCNPVDPTNSRNLLDLFRLDPNGDISGFYPPPEAVNREFTLTFNPEAVAHLTETYRKLKKALYEFIRDKESRGLQFNKGPSHVMPESVFRHSRKRLFKDV